MVNFLSRSVRPFLVAGALSEGLGLATTGVGFGGDRAFFFPFLATVAQEEAPTGAGTGGIVAAGGLVVAGPEVDSGASC
jgi:hypothetical protein